MPFTVYRSFSSSALWISAQQCGYTFAWYFKVAQLFKRTFPRNWSRLYVKLSYMTTQQQIKLHY